MASNEPSTSTGQNFVWNFDNIPVSVRAEGNIGNMMQSIVPEIQRRMHPNPLQGQAQGGAAGREAIPGVEHRLQASRRNSQPSSHTHTINMEPQGGHQHSHGGETANNNDGNAADSNANQNNGQNGQANAMRTVWKMAQSWLPFALLLLTKLLYNHRLGILLFVALFFTFYHANSVLVRQIALREQRSQEASVLYLVWVVVFLVVNVGFVYYIFEDQQLYKSLYLFPPNVESSDLWDLLWIVVITDFSIRFGTIVIKALIALLPRNMLGFKRRGKYYMLVEYLSEFYRSIVPITPWVNFLVNDKQGGRIFSAILVILYTLCKGHLIFQKMRDLYKASKRFLLDSAYGNSPTRDEVMDQGDSCPICQDVFRDPIMLSCKHIFCEDCVTVWFDREKTCPMCRAKIVDHVTWRDGATSAYLMVF